MCFGARVHLCVHTCVRARVYMCSCVSVRVVRARATDHGSLELVGRLGIDVIVHALEHPAGKGVAAYYWTHHAG